MRRGLLNALLYVPSRTSRAASSLAGLGGEELAVETSDGERLDACWIPARGAAIAHVLYCHGNGGDLADRAPHARLLADAGFDVVLFDYRGYGRSSGRPSEDGTYRDARAVREAVARRPGVDQRRLFYLGESLGGAAALALAVESPPAGLILQAAFTSVRDIAAVHNPFVPRAVVPDAYPSLRLIRDLRAPLLVLHGARDDIVPVSHGEALFAAAPEPKRLHVFAGAGHNDLLGRQWVDVIASWAREADAPASTH